MLIQYYRQGNEELVEINPSFGVAWEAERGAKSRYGDWAELSEQAKAKLEQIRAKVKRLADEAVAIVAAETELEIVPNRAGGDPEPT